MDMSHSHVRLYIHCITRIERHFLWELSFYGNTSIPKVSSYGNSISTSFMGNYHIMDMFGKFHFMESLDMSFEMNEVNLNKSQKEHFFICRCEHDISRED